MSERTLWIALHVHADAAWQDDFYPSDLPDAWRPIYLGNEVRCVLTAARHLADTGDEHIEAWVEALEAGLQTLIDDDPDALPEALTVDDVVPLIWDEIPRLSLFARTGHSAGSGLVVASVITEEAPHPAELRRWIEAALEIDKSASIVLLFDGRAAVQAAQQARTIATFMGW
ncbi:MAG: hypothetical protein H6981_01415 [Gammaproteobacteria bacterium]|nr:hypothetical protein [Gammaproteobacteria bacterium]MCP5135445.1 hypothetical protein [Gammaproteobacteria bacterium]